MDKHLPQKPNTQLLIYQTESGDTKIEVRLEDETVWLTQKLMADLFQVAVNTINYKDFNPPFQNLSLFE